MDAKDEQYFLALRVFFVRSKILLLLTAVLNNQQLLRIIFGVIYIRKLPSPHTHTNQCKPHSHYYTDFSGNSTFKKETRASKSTCRAPPFPSSDHNEAGRFCLYIHHNILLLSPSEMSQIHNSFSYHGGAVSLRRLQYTSERWSTFTNHPIITYNKQSTK